MERDKLTQQVIGCAIEVHRNLGPGLLESTYEACLEYELKNSGLNCQTQLPVAVRYKQSILNLTYRIDFVVENKLLLELKSVDSIARLHESQVVTYLKLSGLKTGLLINFNTAALKNGIKRITL